MAHKIITDVLIEPVTIDTALMHLRVDVTDENQLIDALITAAREFAEHYTGRAFAPKTLEMALDEFPGGGIELDMPPVTSVTSVKYTDTAGVEQTIDASDYALSSYGDARRLEPTYSNVWPSTQDIQDAVRIRYVTGYTTLPSAARSAMLLLIGHLYENRQTVSPVNMHEIPIGICSLLNTLKIWGRKC